MNFKGGPTIAIKYFIYFSNLEIIELYQQKNKFYYLKTSQLVYWWQFEFWILPHKFKLFHDLN